MASTRNRNATGDYSMEQRENNRLVDYKTYETYGVPNQTYLPGNGLLQGRVGAEQISHNSVDIESNLRGIRSTDLVNGAPYFNPMGKNLQSLSVSDRLELIMPQPLVVEKHQRPAYMS